jgi:hypothetical protein
VFQYPFKLFITLEKPIRKKLAQLYETVQEHNEVDTLRPDAEVDRPVNNDPVDIEAIQQLKLLEELFDTDLKPMLDMRRDIETKKLATISYTDLWHLFQYGQEVRASDDDTQVYRVEVDGGTRTSCKARPIGGAPSSRRSRCPVCTPKREPG